MSTSTATTAKPWIETPVTESAPLSAAAGCRIFLKHDHLQPSGSFKSRGLGNYMQIALSRAPDPSAVHFYSSSGGNAGLACVYAAKFLGQPATIVVPFSTKPFMIAKIRAAGAHEVIQFGENWPAADKHLRETVIPAAEARGEKAVYVNPFDHPDIWRGHSTLIDEVAKQMPRPDVIVCSVGGCGLFAGICEGLERHGWDKEGTQVVVMNTEGADALWQSKRQGKQVTLPGITSQATSLGATRICDRAWELVQTRDYIHSARLSDAEAAMGSWRLADDEQIIVELACGVNVALCFGGRLEKALGRKLSHDSVVLIELCGGRAVTVDMVADWKRQYGSLDDALSNGEAASVPN